MSVSGTTSEKSFNEQVIDEFRANGGRVGGPFEGAPMILLTTTGAKSGQPRISPLVYSKDGDKLVIIASKGGADTNPDWYHNLVANPEVTLEVGTEKFQARASVPGEPERTRLYDQQAAMMPGFKAYAEKTSRRIPVVVLERLG
ncbi:MAG: AclJ [uncultured Thermomicrobiales bacterium]|uniref:AclJ n=1 Tax=uncultured Thermomicrobiales bacterium TaxID=1645740 RepID=A0A6J4UY34_9BACT|nr:MAG: AclJ [uncultured Thermomicrobiales bacterium]